METIKWIEAMRTYKLKQLLSIKNGRDHKELNAGSIPVYGSGGIMRYGDKALYNDESILLPRKGTLANIQYVDKPFWTVDTIYYSIVNKELAVPFYLFNFLKVLDLSKLNTGTGVPSMTFDSYYNLNIVLPELEAQQKIASALSALDSKIELNNRINFELEAMAKTLYDYWFVQFDFPHKNGKPYKTSGGKMVWNEELKREIPEGWEVKPLGKAINIIRGASPRPINDFLAEKGIPWVKISDATKTDSRFIIETKQFIIEEGVNNSRPVYPNTLILSNSASPAIPRIMKINACVHDGWLVIDRYSGGLTPEFMFHYFDYERPRILSLGSGSIFKNLKTDYLKDFKFIVPSKLVLDELTPQFKMINESIYTKTIENQKLIELRDWLLPMLMNGQVKVSAL